MACRSNDSDGEFRLAALLGNWAGTLGQAKTMGGPITCWASRRARGLLFAAGALTMCLGSFDCQAGVIISQSCGLQIRPAAAVEVDSFAQTALDAPGAGKTET